VTLSQVIDPPLYEWPDLITKLSQLYQLAKQEKGRHAADWRRNYLIVNNRHYQTDVSVIGSPNVTDSEVFPILDSRIAWMTDQKVMIDVMAAATPESRFGKHMSVLARQLENCLDTTYTLGAWDIQIVMALWDAALFGAGILCGEWDSGLDNGLGNVNIRRVDPWTFYPDPNATSLKDAEYLFEVRRMSYSEIERRFPSTSYQMIAEAIHFGEQSDAFQRPGTDNNAQVPMAWPAVLPGTGSPPQAGAWGLEGQTNLHSGQVLQEGVNVYTCWIRENYDFTRTTTDATLIDSERVVTDSWRVVVYSGRTVLLDELAENLWQESRHPYVRLVDVEIGDFWPTPITSHLAPNQIAINRLLSSLQGNAELVGNPIFLDVADSGLNRGQIMNRPGTRLTMNKSAAQAQAQKPDWLRPPDMPPGVANLVQFNIGRMENISGLSGPSKGQLPSGRQGQATTQATQEAGFVRIRSALRNLEASLGELFRLCANLFIQNCNVPRMIAIVGEDGVDSSLRLSARHFYMPALDPGKPSIPMKFSLIVKAGSSAPTSRQSRIAEADALFSMGAIDRQALLEVHNWPRYDDVLQRMEQQQLAAIEQKGLEGGGHAQPRGPGTGHEH
jgi:hypothetical protein